MQIPKRTLAATLFLIVAPVLAAAATPPSLCAPGEQVAFSCPIANSHKTVSLCLQPGGSRPPAARYVFGITSHPELVYPSGAPAPATFRSSFLSYAGATGGRAYSFTRANVKYILYSVSGTGFDQAGVLVQHVGQLQASADLSCRADTAANALDGNMLSATEAWGNDPWLTQHGLPDLH